MSSSHTLVSSSHGKARVRVVVVTKSPSNPLRQTFSELNVRIRLWGGADDAFLKGDNSYVVATDTCKNHVYIQAKRDPESAAHPETFGLALAETFLKEYAHVTRIRVDITQMAWERVIVNGVEHSHGFVKSGTAGTNFATVIGRKSPAVAFHITSGIKDLAVVKTTKSGWANFHQDKYRTLPDTHDRILATNVNTTWTHTAAVAADNFHPSAIAHKLIATAGSKRAQIVSALKSTFYGNPTTGDYSPGVQETLYKMGQSALDAVAEIDNVRLRMPNIHFLPCNLPVLAQNGFKFNDDVFIPTDEPHGIIEATVARTKVASRL